LFFIFAMARHQKVDSGDSSGQAWERPGP